MEKRRPHVVVIGGGFGGISAARALDRMPVDVTVLDRANHHLFQPLLYQVATGTLSDADITAPIRWLLRKHRHTQVLLAEVTEVDAETRQVVLDDGSALAYDYLIVASGARHSYFGHDDWEPFAPGLKSIDDALEIRRRFLLAFEEAERATDEAERRALQTIVIVGAGPTGVELAGLIPVIVREAFAEDFRRIDTRKTRVILLEGGPRVLAAFPEELSEAARQDLVDLGVEVRTNAVVTGVDARGVSVGDERIEARTVLWGAGNAASPLVKTLRVPIDRAGRAQVAPDLSVPGHPEVFVIGDAAAVAQEGGGAVPGVAPAANQMGRHVARNIGLLMRHEPTVPFRYRDKGNLATIGRHKAVADFGGVRLRGVVAWLLWLFVHILYLAGFRNRVSVLLSWAYSYFTYERGVRLITGRIQRWRPAPSPVAPERAKAVQPGW